jgi:signal peptidase I
MDFSLALFIALVITGAINYWDRFFGKPRRSTKARSTTGKVKPASMPLLVEYSRAFFPVILAVFLLRSFVIEPFRIPSGSMLPSLYIGDFILVSKFSYGVRLPILNTMVVPVGEPDRGDVMVFRFPRDPSTNFIKRVIGLPGDVITYRGKRLSVNGEPVAVQKTALLPELGAQRGERSLSSFLESFGQSSHAIFLDDNRQSRSWPPIVVPPEHFFVMGDNRDHSNDSRYWGFVPKENIVGKAFFVWFSWDSPGGGGVNWHRLGTVIQ